MHYVHTPNVCHGGLHDVSVTDGKFQTGIDNVHAHALNLNIQYLTICRCTKLLLGQVHFIWCW